MMSGKRTDEWQTIKMAVLCRSFRLGDFYDYRHDRIIQRDDSWCWESPIEVEKSAQLKFESLDPRSEDSNKWKHMRFDEHVQLSVLSGLIDSNNFSGANNYITDKSNPTKASRTLVYRVKSIRERLNLSEITSQKDGEESSQDENQMNMLEATHIVVGITYGAEAYCVITHQDIDEVEAAPLTQVQIETNLSNLTIKLENALKDHLDMAEFEEQFNQKEKQWIARLNCRLYSDLQSETVQECGLINVYKHYLRLKEQALKANLGKAVPITIQLFPLILVRKGLRNCKVVEYSDVNAELAARFRRVWTELERIEDKVESIRHTVNEICHSSLRQFLSLLVKYKELLKRNLKQAILATRLTAEGDDEKVKRIVDIAERNTLFKPSKLERWLRCKENESKMVANIVNKTGIPLLANKNQLKSKLDHSPEKKYTLVLCLPLLDRRTKKTLKAMENFVGNNTELMLYHDEDDGDDSFEEKENNTDKDELPWRKRQFVFNKVRELARHVENNTHNGDRIQYFILLDQSIGDETDSSYSIYEGERLLKANLDRLLGPPTGLQIHRDMITGNQEAKQPFLFTLEWGFQEFYFPCHFIVQSRLKSSIHSDESWNQLKMTKAGKTRTTILLENQSAIEIRLAADTCIGRSEFSDVIEIDFLLPHTVANQQYLQTSVNDFSSLQKKNRYPNRRGPESINESTVSHVKNSAQKDQMMIERSVKHTENIEISRRIAEIFVAERVNSQLIKPGKPNVYLLNARENLMSADVRLFEIGQPTSQRDHKIIILMGATGSGKSTLIEGMVNYILGVQWKDPFRFKIVREDNSVARNQAHSQTSSVTAYTIHHQEGMAVPYSITIIDTPGYGDTRGIGRDKEITQLIHQFLLEQNSGIDEIHAACFVAASGDSRLTITQRYILNSVLSIFGKDFKENIRLLVTFADNALPPVVDACRVANFPVSSESAGILYSKFNSSVLYAFNKKDDFSFDELFWDMGEENFQRFFTMLEGMNGKDLKSTRQVIQHRKQLEQSLKQTECELEEYLVEIEMLSQKMGKRGQEKSVRDNSNKLNQLKEKMLTLLNQVADNNRSLESSALHWNGFTTADYLSLMMSRVTEEQKPGYEARLERLVELQQMAIVLDSRETSELPEQINHDSPGPSKGSGLVRLAVVTTLFGTATAAAAAYVGATAASELIQIVPVYVYPLWLTI